MFRSTRCLRKLLAVLVVTIVTPRPCHGQFAGNLTGIEIEDLLLLDRVLQLSPAQMAALLDAHDEYVERIAADEPFWLRPYDQHANLQQRIATIRQAVDDYRARARQLRAHDRALFAEIEPTLADHQGARLPIARALIDRRLLGRAIAEIDQTGKRLCEIDRMLLLGEWSDSPRELSDMAWTQLAEYAPNLNRKLAALEERAIDESVETLRELRDRLGNVAANSVDPELSLELARQARKLWLNDIEEIDDLNDRTLLALVHALSVEDAAQFIYVYGSERYPRGHPTWNDWYGLAHVAAELIDLMPEHSLHAAREQVRGFVLSEGVAHIRSAIAHLREHRPRELFAFARVSMSPEQRQSEADRNMELVKIEYELGRQFRAAIDQLWQSIADGDAEELEVLRAAELRHMRALRDAGGPAALPERPATSPMVPVLMSQARHDLRTFVSKLPFDDAQHAGAIAAIDAYRQAVDEHDKHTGSLVTDETRLLLRDAGSDLIGDLRAIAADKEAPVHAAIDRLSEAIDRASWLDRYMFLEGITRADAGRFVMFHSDVDFATLAAADELLQEWHAQALPMFVERVERYRRWQEHRSDPDVPREEKTSLHPIHEAFTRINTMIGQANAEWMAVFADEVGTPDLAGAFYREALPHLFQNRDRLIDQFDIARELSGSTPTLHERVQERWAEFITTDTALHEQMLAIAVRTPRWSPGRDGLTPMGVKPADHEAYRSVLEQRNELHARIAVRLKVLVEAARQ